jgi:hypothetical protein
MPNSMPNLLTLVIDMYNQQPNIKKMGFLTSFFKIHDESFTDANKLNMDMVYGGEDIAPVVRDLSTGAVVITQDEFGNMEVSFPVYSLETPVAIASLMERMPGESAFLTDRANWGGRLAQKIKNGTAKHIDMIKRSIEYQAAQVLTTGKCTLTDDDGNAINQLDYEIPEDHFAEAAVEWDDTDADPLSDIGALDDTIRVDGLCDVVNYVFGRDAWKNFLRNESVQKNLDKNVMNTMAIAPEMRDKGAAYLGKLNLDGRERLFWGYDARYTPFGGSNSLTYLDPNKVIFLPAYADMDFRRYFGGIPNVKPDAVFDPVFGGGKITVGGEYDFKIRIRWDDNAETYFGRTKSRPLLVPASRLRFGCLTTKTSV